MCIVKRKFTIVRRIPGRLNTGSDTGPDTGIEEFFEFDAGTNRHCKRNDLLPDGVDRTFDDGAFTAFKFF